MKISRFIKKLQVRIDNFYYKKVLASLLKTSKLGRGLVLEGAESGINFEHIYNNNPEGTFIIGKYVDKALLRLTTAQATRSRKEYLKGMIYNEIENNKLLNRKTNLLDLASGSARYLRELSGIYTANEVESICIDRDMNCVRLGQNLAKKEGITNIRFLRGNIFRLDHLNRFALKSTWKPSVIVASGLFMYFNDIKVAQMLKELYDFLPPGGSLIFSSYEKVGIKKLMRKTMRVSDGKPWVLYYREPKHVRHMLNDIGFEQIFIMRDQWEMSNVCLGRKPNPSRNSF